MDLETTSTRNVISDIQPNTSKTRKLYSFYDKILITHSSFVTCSSGRHEMSTKVKQCKQFWFSAVFYKPLNKRSFQSLNFVKFSELSAERKPNRFEGSLELRLPVRGFQNFFTGPFFLGIKFCIRKSLN